MPVSVSTETSAICAPPTPLLVRSGGLVGSGFLPWAVMPVAPSLEHAFFHGMLLPWLSLTRMVP